MFLIVVGLYFLLSGGVGVHEKFVSLDEVVSDTPVTTSTQPVAVDAMVEFVVSNEMSVWFNDPRTFLASTDLGAGMFALTPVDVEHLTTYSVVFSENNNSFAVGLLVEPIAQARRDAELYLQSMLGVEQRELLCLLDVYVGVPYTVNEFYSGQNLGLSFCPGSVQLD